MKLKLHKSLVVFDLETTGVNTAHDRIVEIFALRIDPDGTENEYYHRINPGIPIPPEASGIHGIYNKDVEDAPTFENIAHELNKFIGNSDFGGFNSNKFDLPLLVEEFHRVGIDIEIEKRKFVDAQRIYHRMEPRNLSAAYKFYCDKELTDAHTAKADTVATWEIIKAQIERYPEIEGNMDYLHKFSGQDQLVDLAGRIKLNAAGEPSFAFGKYRGQTVAEVFTKDPSYYDWMMRGDFSENTKKTITRLRLSNKNR